MNELWTLPSGVRLSIHDAPQCAGHPCPFHTPSDHPLKNASINWRSDRHLVERMCDHGVGHPDPDHLAWVRMALGEAASDERGVHGCCWERCCGATPTTESEGKNVARHLSFDEVVTSRVHELPLPCTDVDVAKVLAVLRQELTGERESDDRVTVTSDGEKLRFAYPITTEVDRG